MEISPPPEKTEIAESTAESAESLESAERRVEQALARLKELYPNTFRDENPFPLKVGIHKDLQAAKLIGTPPFSNRSLQGAMKLYIYTEAYLKNLQKGAARVDLAGNVAGEVSESEAKQAVDRLARLRVQPYPPPRRSKKEKEAEEAAKKRAKRPARSAAGAPPREGNRAGGGEVNRARPPVRFNKAPPHKQPAYGAGSEAGGERPSLKLERPARPSADARKPVVVVKKSRKIIKPE